MVRDGTDGVAERARVQAGVGGAQAQQPHAPTHDRHVVAGRQLAAIFVPRERRRGRGRRLAEHVDGVALALDEQTRRRLAQHRPRCQPTETRSSAIAEGPRDASCRLKSCQLPRNSAETTCTTSPEPSISCR